MFQIEYDESHVEVFPKHIQIFQLDGHQAPIQFEMVEVNNAYHTGTTHLNLTEIETGRKCPFSVELL